MSAYTSRPLAKAIERIRTKRCADCKAAAAVGERCTWCQRLRTEGLTPEPKQLPVGLAPWLTTDDGQKAGSKSVLHKLAVTPSHQRIQATVVRAEINAGIIDILTTYLHDANWREYEPRLQARHVLALYVMGLSAAGIAIQLGMARTRVQDTLALIRERAGIARFAPSNDREGEAPEPPPRPGRVLWARGPFATMEEAVAALRKAAVGQ